MADEKIRGKCAHPTCRCPAQEDSEYCGEYCENARGIEGTKNVRSQLTISATGGK